MKHLEANFAQKTFKWRRMVTRSSRNSHKCIFYAHLDYPIALPIIITIIITIAIADTRYHWMTGLNGWNGHCMDMELSGWPEPVVHWWGIRSEPGILLSGSSDQWSSRHNEAHVDTRILLSSLHSMNGIRSCVLLPFRNTAWLFLCQCSNGRRDVHATQNWNYKIWKPQTP